MLNLLIVFRKCFSYKAHWSQDDYVTSTSGVSQHLKLIRTHAIRLVAMRRIFGTIHEKAINKLLYLSFSPTACGQKRTLPRWRWLVDRSHKTIRAIRLEIRTSMVDHLPQDQRNMAFNFQLPHFEACSGTLIYAIPLVNMQGARLYSVHLCCMQVALLAELSWQLGT